MKLAVLLGHRVGEGGGRFGRVCPMAWGCDWG